MTFLPTLSPAMETLFRIVSGLLCLGTLLLSATNWRFFFSDQRFGGYAENSAKWGWWHRPGTLNATFALWAAALAFIVAGVFVLPASIVNLVFAYHFFIRLRWKSLLRGMGAPGFMWTWLAFAIFALQVSGFASDRVKSIGLLTLQVDFALIMLCAGVSKITSGYFNGEGIEYGLANPMWGHTASLFSKVPSNLFFFRLANHGAWLLQFVSGTLMLIPSTRVYGASVMAIGFVAIALQIRLGLLSEMVIACTLLYFAPGSWLDDKVTGWFSLPARPTSFTLPEFAGTILETIFIAYLAIRVLLTIGMWINFYGRKTLPPPLQKAQEFLANRLGVILWRVFTVDQLNFFVRIYADKRGRRELISKYGALDLRWSSVAEAIAVTTLFTTLKYFPNQPNLFRDRILRYVNSLPVSCGDQIIFEYVSIKKEGGRFSFKTACEFYVNRSSKTVEEKVLDSATSLRTTAAVSSAHACDKPGSYVAPVPT